MELAQKIKAAAAQLFFKRGIKAVSMDDVSKAVGISKRTLYEAFPSKDALLMACVEDMLNVHVQKMEDRIAVSETFIDLMLGAVNDAMMFMEIINPAFFEDIERLNYVSVDDSVRSRLDGIRSKMASLIEEGKERGYLSQDVDSQLVAAVILGEPNKGLMRRIAAARGCDVFYVVKSLCVIFLRGMATVKGARLIDERVALFNKTTQTQR